MQKKTSLHVNEGFYILSVPFEATILNYPPIAIMENSQQKCQGEGVQEGKQEAFYLIFIFYIFVLKQEALMSGSTIGLFNFSSNSKNQRILILTHFLLGSSNQNNKICILYLNQL